MPKPPVSALISGPFLALLALLLLPAAAVFYWQPDALPWLGWGAGLWALALLLKLFLLGPVYALIEPKLPVWLSAGLWGLASGLAELGLTAGFLLRLPTDNQIETALWLGLGTGMAEILLILGIVLFQREAPGWSTVFERAYTLGGHVFSRGLTALGLRQSLILILTLGIFGAVDGLASYGQTRGWNFAEPRTARWFHTGMAAVVLCEALLFWRLNQGF